MQQVHRQIQLPMRNTMSCSTLSKMPEVHNGYIRPAPHKKPEQHIRFNPCYRMDIINYAVESKWINSSYKHIILPHRIDPVIVYRYIGCTITVCIYHIGSIHYQNRCSKYNKQHSICKMPDDQPTHSATQFLNFSANPLYNLQKK